MLFTLRNEKELLMENACHLMTYSNHGEETLICKQLRTDPEKHLEIGHFLYEKPLEGSVGMCGCPQCHSTHGIFSIPAIVTDPNDNKKDRHSVLETSKMYERTDNKTLGSIFFRIPDEKWLRRNRWTSGSDSGPYFVEKFLLMLPPDSSTITNYKVNMRLLYSTLHKQTYKLESRLTVVNRVTLNPLKSQCEEYRESSYSMPEYNVDAGGVCVNSGGELKGMLLPTLVGSMWEIVLESDKPLEQLYPATIGKDKSTLYLKVMAKFCSKSGVVADSSTESSISRQKRSVSSSNSSSFPCRGNEFFDIVSNSDSGSRIDAPVCSSCPDGSKAMLSNYFCEKCPMNDDCHNADRRYYGCTRGSQDKGNNNCEEKTTIMTTVIYQ